MTGTTAFLSDLREAQYVVSQQQQLRINAKAKVARYHYAQCQYALADCHETLKVGEHEYSSPYGQKLWAEIDAIRDRLMALSRK